MLGLGYAAGRAKKFDADQVIGLNELVLDYAMPALLFVATVKTPRAQLLHEGSYALALLIAFAGLFLAIVFVSTHILRHSLRGARIIHLEVRIQLLCRPEHPSNIRHQLLPVGNQL